MALTVLTLTAFQFIHLFIIYWSLFIIYCLQCGQDLCSLGATVEIRMDEGPELTAQVGEETDRIHRQSIYPL